MYSIKIKWKEFKVDLISMNNYLVAKIDKYKGNQASGDLELFFSEEPTKAEHDAINDYFNSLNNEDELLKLSKTSRKTGNDRVAFFDNVKDSILKKADNELTIVEKKIRDQIQLTDDEIDTLGI